MNEPKPLPSETKLVETPRTDAAFARCVEEGGPYEPFHGPLITESEALERELASLADELRLAQTELKGCYRLIDELKEELRLARERVGEFKELVRSAFLQDGTLVAGSPHWVKRARELIHPPDAAASGPKEGH